MRMTHGMTHTPLYQVWSRMKGCTSSSTHQDFKYYGALGVKLCPEWEKFENFYEWAISNGYRRVLTIDRMDTHGDYSPDNCRWITLSAQQGNRRNCHMVTLNGKTQCLSYWCKELGINWYTVYSRLKKGWSYEQALMTPIKKRCATYRKCGCKFIE